MSGENPNPSNTPSQEEIDAALAAAGQPAQAPASNAPAAPSAAASPIQSGDAAQAEAAVEASAGTNASAEAVASVGPATTAAATLHLPDFGPAAAPAGDRGIDLISDVELDVKIELGRAMMLIEDVLKLGEGSVVELDKLAGDPVDVFVNDRLVARGEVLVLNDNFCVRVSEIVAGQELVEEGA